MGRGAEHVQDSDDGGVGGEYSQADRRDHCDEDDDGHEVRDHDRPTLGNKVKNLPAAAPHLIHSTQNSAQFSNLPALTLCAVDD